MRKKNEKLPISVALISFNEEDRIADTLDSIRDLASEIVLVDSGSKDKTVEIAERFGAKIFRKEWEGYKNQKNYALSKCSNEWILFLDCDEVVSESLKESIIKAVTNPTADGYMINRKTVYLGKVLNYAFQPDWKLRLVKKSSNPRWEGGNVHEYLVVDGKISKLKGELFHYSFRNINEHFKKLVNYSKISADDMYINGKKFRIYNLIFNPFIAFSKEFVIKKGFLDGIRGLIVAVSVSFYTFLKYAFLWERCKRGKN